MELKSLTVSGFRRFSQKTKVQLEGKLVALVGANEAGKTSLLEAIALHHRGAITDRDHSYAQSSRVEITLSYFLSSVDAATAGIDQPTWFHVTKGTNNQLTGQLERYPPRDLSKRTHCAEAVTTARTRLAQYEDSKFARIWSEKLSTDLDTLLTKRSDAYVKSEFQSLEILRSEIESAEFKKRPELAPAMSSLSAAVADLVSFERQHDPHQAAVAKLMPLRPKVLEFTSEYRELGLPYNIRLKNSDDKKQQPKEPSKPLQELMDLVGLNLDELIAADAQSNRAARQGILKEANERLRTLWSGRWSQSDAYPQFDLERSHLDLLIAHDDGFDARHQFNNYAERSAGYRQFIALQIFALLKEIDGAVLLIDELEQHLHYDAQADVVQMLTAERRIGKVVYATHSAGCLPEDLGSGVKLVHWRPDDPKQSTVVNRFWALDNSGGFAPLLFGMGATTMSFLPTRRAVIGEGATEMLLLPRMLKEALGTDRLGFQILHGLSNFSLEGIPAVDRAVAGVAFITDNDAGGESLRRSLSSVGIPEKLILKVGNPKTIVTIEDLIEPSIWLEAVNRVGAQLRPPVSIVSAPASGRITELPPTLRTRKIDIAYTALELAATNPALQVSDPAHRGLLLRLADDIEAGFLSLQESRSAGSSG